MRSFLPYEHIPFSLNFFRRPRPGNMMHAYCIPSSSPVTSTINTPSSEKSTRFMDLPEFDAENMPDMAESVNRWDAALESAGAGMKVMAMGIKEIKMDVKKGWW
jgi:hypothetical protein